MSLRDILLRLVCEAASFPDDSTFVCYLWVLQVSIRLQRDAKLSGQVPVIGTADRTMGPPMRNVLRKNAPGAPTVSLAFTVSLLTAVFLPDAGHLLETGHLLEKGHFFMAKATASDARPGTAADNAMPPARDPKLAVEEEYQMARRLNTVQSLELFIARHPDDPLAARARADLRLLTR
jgi:hypothetical protein